MMGMYTELVLATRIKDGAAVDVLKFMCGDGGEEPATFPDHEFFETNRGLRMFHSASYYFVPRAHSSIVYDDISKNWSLIVRCDLKNYDSEIEKFIDWISPHLDDRGDMAGYYRYEEDREPTIIYAPE